MRMVEKWRERLLKKGGRFAMIQTTHAIYDLVAIIAEMQSLFIIQYPKVDRSGGVSIVQENISKKDIDKIRYYQEK